MKGDFSRVSFDRTRHARGVLVHQGAVQLDAEQNELQAVQSYRVETETVDVVGPAGVPKEDDGFRLTLAAPDQLTIGKGRIYVDGLLAENDTADVPVTDQPALPGYTLPDQAGLYVAFVDVRLRALTGLQDETIREVALGGIDTSIRETVVWQVKLLRIGDHDATATCSTSGAAIAAAMTPQPRGTLAARARFGSAGPRPCDLAPGAAFRGVENQLYRVEIHRGGGVDVATFKWSRNNASLVAAWLPDDVGTNRVKVGPVGRDGMPGFAPGQWVELLDDTNELYDDTAAPAHAAVDPAGRPGTLVKVGNVVDHVLVLDAAPPTRGSHHPMVRAWDMTEGAIKLNATTTDDGFIELEDGVQVQFDQAGVYTAGDYWLIPARTITADVQWPSTAAGPDARPPDGVQHHYAPVALLTTADGQAWTLLDDCRKMFPALTGMCAEDVCFDNQKCAVPGAETVQDALDALCARSDLKKHNKHLHGWGVVCGLQVDCGDEQTPSGSVMIRHGYAIDCEGNDLDLLKDRPFDALAAAGVGGFVDGDGNGDIDLAFRTGDPSPDFTVVKHVQPKDTLREFLEGTIILDFVDECVKPLQTFYDAQFTVPPGGEIRPVGPIQKRVTTLSNLLVQLVNPNSGGTVFIAPTEHAILKTFYTDLRKLLSSHTFCAMWEGVQAFPDPYPFGADTIDTIFGKGFHHRLRVHPNAQIAYTTGLDNKIHVYDLATKNLAVVLDHPAGKGARVTDVAFDKSGKRLYATAISGNDTVFAQADINGVDHTWQPHAIMCDVHLLTLATNFAVNEFVYAVGDGKGLYVINPANVDAHPNPVTAFGATGPMSMAAGTNLAYAVAKTGSDFSVVAVDLTAPATPQASLALPGVNRVDDILALVEQNANLVAPDVNVQQLFLAVNDPGGKGSALAYTALSNGKLASQAPPRTLRITERPSPLALGYHAGVRSLLITVADENRLVMYDVRGFASASPGINVAPLFGSQPVQISPVAVAAGGLAVAYVLNQGSNTISVVPARLLGVGSDIVLADVKKYRIDVLNAMADLLGGLLQYLKDCFCERLLVDCPTCDDDDKIYLACVHIRKNKIHQICNFSKRRYVKSFPTVGYWLSIVPIVPLIDRVVEIACCAILPDLFGKFDATTVQTANDRLSTGALQTGLALFDKAGTASMRANVMSGLKGIGPILGGFLSAKAQEKPAARVDKTDVVGQPVDDARTKLADRGIVVERVEPLDRARGLTNLVRVTTAPTSLPPGTRVTLVEEDGVVRYYATTRPADQADFLALSRALGEAQQAILQRDADLRAVRSDVQAVTRQQAEIAAVATPDKLENIAQLRATLESARAELAARDQEIAALRDSVAALRTEVANAPTRLTSIEAELRDLREFRGRVNTFLRDQPDR
jgi:hypothetical protein